MRKVTTLGPLLMWSCHCSFAVQWEVLTNVYCIHHTIKCILDLIEYLSSGPKPECFNVTVHSTLSRFNYNHTSFSRIDAIKWLHSTSKERARVHCRRLFRVSATASIHMCRKRVYDSPKVDGATLGFRFYGELVIPQVVREDGWLQLSALDTFWGYIAEPSPDVQV